MTPENFVTQLRKAVVDENIAIYRDLFESTAPDAASDPYWKRALSFYDSLDEAGRRVLFEIMRQTSVDTVSNLLAVLDGVSALDSAREDFVLRTSSDPQQINGSLQDLFLEADERNRQ
ncbi:MAG: hypothetical protein SFU53_06335 [Terrimicrobiaceae bacterium]|nr:hypothetical protein [Terrimicrobiaceae bacterium]